MNKILLITLIALPVIVIAALVAVGWYMVNFGLVRPKGKPDASGITPASEKSSSAREALVKNYTALRAETDRWLAAAPRERLHITTDDGLKLISDCYPVQDSHGWLLGVHGYISKKEDYHNVACVFASKGYNILLPDLRSHGESAGKYIGMGWLDRLDILKWIDRIIEMDPEAEIILHGTSMGAATVMMASGEHLPANVKGVVEDCGYTSVWDIFVDELSYLFHLPPFPVLHAANVVAYFRAGYNFREASAVKMLQKACLPMLFIHGGSDIFVHTDMVYKLYEACPTKKEILVVEGAGHGESYCVDPEAYFGVTFDFLEKNCFSGGAG